MVLRSKQEIADLLGISTATLRRWLKPVMHQLKPLGYHSHRILTIPMLEIIYKHLVISESDFPPRPNLSISQIQQISKELKNP